MSRRPRLPHTALLVLAILLAGMAAYLTWPSRATILCEQLPQLAVMALCAATFLVVSFRALSSARAAQENWRLSAGAAILAGLALFLSAHYIALYRKPCVDVQHQLQHPAVPAKHP